MKIYTLDQRCLPAMEQVRAYYLSVPRWQRDVAEGKMFGVLVYEGNDRPFPPPAGLPPMPDGLTFPGRLFRHPRRTYTTARLRTTRL